MSNFSDNLPACQAYTVIFVYRFAEGFFIYPFKELVLYVFLLQDFFNYNFNFYTSPFQFICMHPLFNSNVQMYQWGDGGSPPISQKFVHPPSATQKNPPQQTPHPPNLYSPLPPNLYSPSPHQKSVPPLNNNFQVITQ